MTPPAATALRRALLKWYRVSARELPWRESGDPYRIWLSEILLLQTRVETALARILAAETGLKIVSAAALSRIRHAYSHFAMTLRLYRCEAKGRARARAYDAVRWIPADRLDTVAMPGADRKALAAAVFAS